MARKLGVSRQAVHDLVKRGIIQKTDHGFIDEAAAIEAISNQVRPSSKISQTLAEQATPAQQIPPEHAAAAADQETATSYHVAKTLREAAEARIAQLKLAELKGELIRVDAIRSALSSVISAAREALLQIPARLAPVVAAESDPAAVHQAIDKEIHAALAQLTAAPDRITRLEERH